MNELEKISESFREHLSNSSSNWIIVLLAIAVVILLAALARMLFSPAAQARRAIRARLRLFADANGLDGREEDVLFKIAAHYQVESPTLLFIKRSVFEQAVASLGLDAIRADAIRRKIYSP